MARRTDPKDDDWHKVQDSKKRKQIQDRLAQRARRTRLREAKNNAKHGQGPADTRGRSNDTQYVALSRNVPVSDTGPHVVSYDSITISTTNCDSTDCTGPSRPLPLDLLGSLDFSQNFLTPSPSTQPHFPMTVFSALYINGQILGLTCGTTVPSKSSLAGPTVPLPLHPTELQLITVHPRWIDRFPFPTVRNAMITLNGIMDDEEFIRDIFMMPSFEIIVGRGPWDPRAWKIEKCFADKWGYLFV